MHTKTTDIDTYATACAAEHRRQGWESDGGAYDIGVYYGDAEGWAEQLGRELTRDELVELERAIRLALGTGVAAPSTVGDRVEGGARGTEDYDVGTVVAVDGDQVEV